MAGAADVLGPAGPAREGGVSAEKEVARIEDTHGTVADDVEPIGAKVLPPPARVKQPQLADGVAALNDPSTSTSPTPADGEDDGAVPI